MKCPYCHSDHLKQLGTSFYMCNVCRGKFLNADNAKEIVLDTEHNDIEKENVTPEPFQSHKEDRANAYRKKPILDKKTIILLVIFIVGSIATIYFFKELGLAAIISLIVILVGLLAKKNVVAIVGYSLGAVSGGFLLGFHLIHYLRRNGGTFSLNINLILPYLDALLCIIPSVLLLVFAIKGLKTKKG